MSKSYYNMDLPVDCRNATLKSLIYLDSMIMSVFEHNTINNASLNYQKKIGV